MTRKRLVGNGWNAALGKQQFGFLREQVFGRVELTFLPCEGQEPPCLALGW